MNDNGRFMSYRVAVGTLVAVLALGLVALGATRLISGTDAASLVATKARTAAISALENEYLAIGSNDAAAIDRLFTGAALVEMRQQRQHIRQLITDDDYPGKKTLSNVQVLSITGDYATTMTIDFTAHVRLANMKGSRTVDYSEADEICHVIVVQDDGAWKVSEVLWEYAPGSGP